VLQGHEFCAACGLASRQVDKEKYLL
jgi:hypothetical protein